MEEKKYELAYQKFRKLHWLLTNNLLMSMKIWKTMIQQKKGECSV